MIRLSGSAIAVLEEIDFLSRMQARRSPSGARYCCPSEAYLSRKVGVRREQISRIVSNLARLGILEVIGRRRRGGNWSTNLYKLVSRKWWKHMRLLKVLVHSHRVRYSVHKQSIRGDVGPGEGQKGAPSAISTSEILQRWLKRE